MSIPIYCYFKLQQSSVLEANTVLLASVTSYLADNNIGESQKSAFLNKVIIWIFKKFNCGILDLIIDHDQFAPVYGVYMYMYIIVHVVFMH